jgi:hypothetical protein
LPKNSFRRTLSDFACLSAVANQFFQRISAYAKGFEDYIAITSKVSLETPEKQKTAGFWQKREK